MKIKSVLNFILPVAMGIGCIIGRDLINDGIENYKMKHNKDGEMCLFVKVSPDGIAEERFLNKYVKDIPSKEMSVALHAIFGSECEDGWGPYNGYTIRFHNVKDLRRSMRKLRDNFYNLSISEEFTDDYIPQVMWRRIKVYK